MKKKAAREFYARLKAANPEPKGELQYINPYTLLVAVVLSAQATDAGVNKATKLLFRKVKTPAAMVRLGEEGVKKFIKSIGLYNTKAKNLIKLSRILIDEHEGRVPKERGALEALPGVGRKTANVVLNIAFGRNTIAVDTHVFRLANRSGLATGRTPLEVEKKLLEVTPESYLRHAHHWLILHGRYVCKARKPECGRCPVRDLCAYKEKIIPGASG